MRACISPVDIHAGKTLNISKYADCVHNVQNESIINRDWTSNEIQKMHQQLEYLQAKLCVREERISSDEMRVLKGRIGVNVAKVNRLGKLRKVKNARPHSFSLDEDTSNYGTY